jgi:hypothetical protein
MWIHGDADHPTEALAGDNRETDFLAHDGEGNF